MAAQIEGPGQIQEFLDILKRRRWQILLPAAFLISLGVAFAVVVPKKYLVKTQVELRELFLDDEQRGQARDQARGIAENAPEQIRSPKRIQEVLEGRKWADYLTLEDAEKADYNERVRDNLSVMVPRSSGKSGSSFVTIEYRDVDKERAQQLLKSLRETWITQVVERERTRYNVEYSNLLERQSELDKEYKKLKREQQELLTEHDISPTQPAPGQNQQRIEDPTVVRFQENTDRQEEVELELATKSQQLRLAETQLAETDPEVPKTRVTEGNSFQSELSDLLKQQLTLEQQLDGITPEHPRYKLVSKQLTDLEERMEALELRRTGTEVSQDFEANPVYLALENLIRGLELDIGRLEAEKGGLRLAIEQNRRDLLRLTQSYNEFDVLTDKTNIVKATLEEIRLELEQKRLRRDVIYGAAGNPFQIIQEVQPPLRPTEPDPILIVLFSVVLGLGIGLGSALIAEFSKSCFRGASDLNRVLVVPVLGVISPIVTRIQRRRLFMRRLALGSMSFGLISVVLFVTWAWANEPDLLGDRVNETIADFRELFL